MTAGDAIHQVVSILEPVDAVGNEVLQVQAGLRAAGHSSDIFAAHRHSGEPGAVRDLAELASQPSPAAAVYHFATASTATAWLAASDLRVVVVYHNVTPAEYFYGIDALHYDACIRALDDLALLRDRAALAIGHSEFSRRELESMGFRATAATPLVLDLARLDGPGVRSKAPVLLTAGRIAPNKRIEDVLRLHAALRRTAAPDAELWIAGDASRLPSYAVALRALSADLGTADAVRWLGRLSNHELATCYRSATLYVSMSEHEGFAAPLVEAMHCGLPVLARDCGAVAETTGDAAVLIPRDAPLLGAELAAAMLRDAALRDALSARGRRRAAELDGSRSLARLLSLVAPEA